MPCQIGPQQFEFKEKTCAIDWENWLRSFELFADASDMPIEKKKSWLLHYAGPKVQSIYHNLHKSKDSERSAKTQYRKAVKKLTKHFAPEHNTSYERHIFHGTSQQKDERIDTFVMRLRIQAERCKFGKRIDDHIKDQITSSCYSGILRRKLLERNHQKLTSVLKLCRVFESVANQEKMFVHNEKREEMPTSETLEVCNIGNRKRFREQYYDQEVRNRECSRCGGKGHKPDDERCPAKGKKCGRCGRVDHFARKCNTKLNNWKGEGSAVKPTEETVRMIYDDYDDTF